MRCKFLIFGFVLVFLIILSLEITSAVTPSDAASCQLCRRYADNNGRANAVWKCVNFNDTALLTDFVGDVDGNDDFDFKVNCTNQEIQQECRLCRRFNDSCGSNCVHNAPWKCANFNNTALLTDFLHDVNVYDYFDLKVDCNIPELQTGCQICRRWADNNGRATASWGCVNFDNTALLTDFTGNVNSDDDFDFKVNCASCGNSICESNLGENTKNCLQDCPCTVPIDVVLTIDRSGSMANPIQKLIDAKAAAISFVDLMNNSKDKIGLVSFGGSQASDATLDQNLTLDFISLKAEIDSLTAISGAGTPMGQGILRARNEIASHGRANIKHTIILLSDGMPTRNASGGGCGDGPTSPNSCTNYALQEATTAKNAGIIIYTIGLGIIPGTAVGDFATALLKNISSSTNYYYAAPTSSDLGDLFKALAGITCPSHRCSNESQIILRLSDTINANGEFYNGAGDYPWEICYDEIFPGQQGNGNRACNDNKVLGLSSQTNALASIPESSSNINVCYGDLSCMSTTENCSSLGADYRLVVSLSANSNANLSSGNDLPVRICCKIFVPLPQIELTSAYWTNLNDVQITRTGIGQEVMMVAEGAPNETLINFNIYTSAGTFVANASSSISQGKASAIWNASAIGTYYFNASVVSDPSISRMSGNLDVSQECIPITCNQIFNEIKNERSDVVDIYGSWPDGCGDSIDCGECDIGIKVIDDELNSDGGICINEDITYCNDYDITNFGSLLSAKGNCTADTRDVAVYSVEEKRSVSCGLQADGCTRNCYCEWKDIDGEEQCVENWKDNDCTNPGDNGICDFLRNNIIKDCSQPPIGWLNQTNYYNWTGINPNPTDCPESVNGLTRCISRTTLGFLSTSGLVIAVIIIVIFYLVVIRKPQKRKK